MKNKNLSSWADAFDYDELSSEMEQCNLSLDLLEDARGVLQRNAGRVSKQSKTFRQRRECWQ